MYQLEGQSDEAMLDKAEKEVFDEVMLLMDEIGDLERRLKREK